jgi:hypothetical protein
MLAECTEALRVLLQLLLWVRCDKVPGRSPFWVHVHHKLDGISRGLLLACVTLKLGMKCGNSIVKITE